MSTCGYICPVCEGKGFLDNLSNCNWCKIDGIVEDVIIPLPNPNDELENS
jgi:hypothetical protein